MVGHLLTMFWVDHRGRRSFPDFRNDSFRRRTTASLVAASLVVGDGGGAGRRRTGGAAAAGRRRRMDAGVPGCATTDARALDDGARPRWSGVGFLHRRGWSLVPAGRDRP